MRFIIFILILATSCISKKVRLQDRLEKIPPLIDSLYKERLRLNIRYADDFSGDMLDSATYDRYQRGLLRICEPIDKKVEALRSEKDSIMKLLSK